MTFSIAGGPTDTSLNLLNQLNKPDRLQSVARAFEAAMLSEMLRSAGAGQAAAHFGGGVGEDQFASFLVHAQAERIADRGGIGLAEMAMRAMMPPQTADGAS